MGRSRPRPSHAVLAVLLLLVVLSGCGGSAQATPTATTTATATALPTPTSTSVPNLDQRIDAYIASLTPAQQIGQTLMLAVYANGYNANLEQALTQWHLGS